MEKTTKLNIEPAPHKIWIKSKVAEVGGFAVENQNLVRQEGIVAGVAKEVEDVKIGDEIYFTPHGPDIITVEGEEYFVLDTASLGYLGKKKK
ncbi:MAG: hypothetical protein KGJ90_06495 [Patescibacteria group bacterium]|nr:hypothetical protein [Patescibacteria group bacterium]